MSTTFGLRISNKYDLTNNEVVRRYGIGNGKVAFDWLGGRRWQIKVALMDDDTPIYPLDNTAQGIYTLGDVRKAIKMNDANDLYEKMVTRTKLK